MHKFNHARYSAFAFFCLYWQSRSRPRLLLSRLRRRLCPSPCGQGDTLQVSDAACGRVLLDVVVTDKAGKPESGLEFTDFTPLDKNQPDKILSLRASSGNAQKAGPPTGDRF